MMDPESVSDRMPVWQADYDAGELAAVCTPPPIVCVWSFSGHCLHGKVPFGGTCVIYKLCMSPLLATGYKEQGSLSQLRVSGKDAS